MSKKDFYYKRKSKLLINILRLEQENKENKMFEKLNNRIIKSCKDLIECCNINLQYLEQNTKTIS
jgi:hypothetical protein